MARPPNRPGRGALADQDTRARLLEAGKEEFLEQGLKGARIAAICRRAELANGTFYIHFKSKDDLYLCLLQTAASELALRLRAADKTGLDARGRDRLEVSIIVAFAEERSDLFRLLSDERASYAVAHNAFFDTLNEQRRLAIKRGIAAGEFRSELDPRLAAVADFGVTTEVVQWWLNNRKAPPRAVMIEKLVDMRARMFFPDPETP